MNIFSSVFCVLILSVITTAIPVAITPIEQALKQYSLNWSSNVFPFVSKCTTNYNKNKICMSYYDMILNIHETKLENMTIDDIKTETITFSNNNKNSKEFCPKFAKIIPKQSKFPELNTGVQNFHSLISDNDKCVSVCLNLNDDTEFVVNPLCLYIMMGYSLIESDKKNIAGHNVVPTAEKVTLTQKNETIVANVNKLTKKDELDVNQTPKKTEPKTINSVVSPVVKVNEILSSDMPETYENSGPETPIIAVEHQKSNENQNKQTVAETKLNEIGKTQKIVQSISIPSTTATASTQVKPQPKLADNKLQNLQINNQPDVHDPFPKIAADVKESVLSSTIVNTQKNPPDSIKTSPKFPKPTSTSTSDQINNEEIPLQPENDDLLNDDEDDENLGYEMENGKTIIKDDASVNSNVNSNNNNINNNHNINNNLNNINNNLNNNLNIRKEEQEEENDDPFVDSTDSNFFTYFMFLMLICILGYVAYHNKTKVLALVLEGRRSHTGRNNIGRRKHTAAYRKLDSNLEEAITSSASNRSTQIIY